MQNGCAFPNFSEKFPKDLPKKYRQSIVSVKQSGNIHLDDFDESHSDIKTYYLKDSTAFGQPLAAIEDAQGYEWGHIRLIFKNTEFLKLRPQFKLPVPNPQDDLGITVSRNDKKGYDAEYVAFITLDFDKKSKSITCTSSI